MKVSIALGNGISGMIFTLEEGQAVYLHNDTGPIPAEKLADRIRQLDPRTNWISWHRDSGRMTVAVSKIGYVRNVEEAGGE